MDLINYVGSYSCDKILNIETWEKVVPDGTEYLPYQGKVKFSIIDDQTDYLEARFTGAIGNGELIERVGKLIEIKGLGLGLLFEQRETTPYAFYFYPVEICAEKEVNGKKNFLLIINVKNERIAIKIEG